MPEIDLSLTSRGIPTNTYRLRETHMRLRALKSGVSTQLVIALLGDSWVQGGYWSEYFAKDLQDTYGNAGVGFTGFAFFAPLTGGPWVDGGNQPTGRLDGNVRPDLVPAPVLIGNWVSVYNSPGQNTPTLGIIYSSTAGDRVRISFPAGHNAGTLFYNGSSSYGNGTSVVRYSWNAGVTWETSLTLSYQGSGQIALNNVPAGAGTLIFEIVSGTVALAGVDLRSASNGVRVHKLGISGGSTVQLANTNNTYANAIAALAPNLVIGGWETNEKNGSITPTDYSTHLTTVLGRIRTAVPNADVLLTAPPENTIVNLYTMAQYTAITRTVAATDKCALLDHQANFGELPAEYAWSNPSRQWLGADLIHPVKATGGNVLAYGVLEVLKHK